jgi:hypothetical protein
MKAVDQAVEPFLTSAGAWVQTPELPKRKKKKSKLMILIAV